MSWHRSRTCCKQATFENSISGDRSPSVRHCLNSPMSSHLIIIVISLRFWCVYSVLARRHCYLLSAIKQRCVQFQSWDPLSFFISAVWYFQLVWVFLYSVFPVFVDSSRVSNTSPQGGYSEGANVLLSAYLLSSMSYHNSHQLLSFSTRYGTLFRSQKPTRKQRSVNSSMSVHHFSESEALMHQLTIFSSI